MFYGENKKKMLELIRSASGGGGLLMSTHIMYI